MGNASTRFRSSRRDLHAISDLEVALSTWRPREGRVLERALPLMVELLETEFVGCYLPMRTVDGWVLEHGQGQLRGGQTRALEALVRHQLEKVVAAAPKMMRLGFVPPSEQNRVVSTRETWSRQQWESHPITTLVMPALGFDRDCYDLRVHCAHRGANLGWCGAYQREPFTLRQRVLFQKLVPALRNQVINERRLGFAALHEQAFVAAMEAVPYPAYLVDAAARVVATNALARQTLKDRNRTTQARLGEILRSVLVQPRRATLCEVGDATVSVVSAPMCPVHYLIIERPATASLERRVAGATRNWGLTNRQRDVLRWVAEGEPNKEIASRLACSVRSVEYHISGILARAGLRSRAGLMSKLLG